MTGTTLRPIKISKIALLVLLGAVFVGALPSNAASQWRVTPEVRVTGGDESDLVIDPGLTRAIVPGGGGDVDRSASPRCY